MKLGVRICISLVALVALVLAAPAGAVTIRAPAAGSAHPQNKRISFKWTLAPDEYYGAFVLLRRSADPTATLWDIGHAGTKSLQAFHTPAAVGIKAKPTRLKLVTGTWYLRVCSPYEGSPTDNECRLSAEVRKIRITKPHLSPLTAGRARYIATQVMLRRFRGAFANARHRRYDCQHRISRTKRRCKMSWTYGCNLFKGPVAVIKKANEFGRIEFFYRDGVKYRYGRQYC